MSSNVMGSDRRPVLVVTPEFKADAPRRLAELRARGPIHRVRGGSGLDLWMVVSYSEARAALTHPALLKDPSPAEEALREVNYTGHKPTVGIGGNMLTSDPPDHTRLRRLVAGAFTPRHVQGLAPRIQQIADDLLDAMARQREVDLVEAYTAPLPLTVICEMLGVPQGERRNFRAWTRALLGSSSDTQRAGARNLSEYLADLIERKRAESTDDLLSALITVHSAEDGRLSRTELISTGLLLVVGGHDTTVNLLGNAMLALLQRPDQADLLRARPELIGGAVEEFLRYDAPLEQTTLRYAAEDLELGGRQILRGDVVMVMLASASRDAPQPDGDDPDVLDVARANARHLAFGHGIHHCLGAPLARMEAVIGISSLLRRFSDLRPVMPLEEVPRISVGPVRGPRSLLVRLGDG
ncbi:cytochrome P450 [Micromonospora sp. NPDC049559]|uniref:cytochrome P450 family protein n=1 Tax=Micromonospora sp. NPDC049559 TaxID=3155923 RepID=UPI00341AFF6A